MPFFNTWVRWNINGVPYQYRKSKQDVCTFTFNKTNNTVNSYKQELINNAKLIREYYSDPFDVLYSGGIDSEIILLVFKELGIKHNTIIVRYKNDYNYREIGHALNTVNALNIPYKIIDFDLEKFYENEAYDLCKRSSCIRVGRVVHIKFCIDFCDNIPVMGEGDIYWSRINGTDYSKSSQWKFLVSEASHNCSMYMTKLGRENVCDFYEFTPNLIKAYNQQPIMQNLLNDKIPGKISNWSSKWLMHQVVYPNLTQRVKLTGFEKNNEPGYMPLFIKNLQVIIENELGPGNDYWYTVEELDQII